MHVENNIVWLVIFNSLCLGISDRIVENYFIVMEKSVHKFARKTTVKKWIEIGETLCQLHCTLNHFFTEFS